MSWLLHLSTAGVPLWTDIGSLAVLTAQLLVLSAAAAFAGWQVWEARKLREGQSRPFVVIDFEPAAQIFFEIKIRNIGTMLARDVTFQFDPPLESTLDEKPGYTPLRELSLFQDGIPSLPPGKEIAVLFDKGPDRLAARLPDSYRVTVSYTREPIKHPYREETVLDLKPYWNVRRINRRDIHDVHERLKEISEAVQAWETPSP